MRAFLLALLLVSQAPRPEPRTVGHMAYDTVRDRLLLVESGLPAGPQRVWTTTPDGWAIVGDPGPPGRELEAVTFDPTRGVLLLHGGMRDASAMLGDFWQFDGAVWSPLPAEGPGLRDHHAITYDTARRRVVLFGGRVSQDRLGDDTWEFDGSRWHAISGPGPGPGGRAHASLVYDSLRRRAVLYGGIDPQGRTVGDLWTWDGRRWTRGAETGPPARSHHRMAFDPRRGVMVLFGGQLGTRALGDTWLWDGRRWTQVPPSDDDPARRGHHVMAWDARRQRVVMYGGGYLDGDQYRRHEDWWSWSGSRWERLRWPLQAELLAQRRILRAQAPGPGVEGVVGRLRQRQPRQPAATAPPGRGTGGGRGTAKGRRAERGGPTST